MRCTHRLNTHCIAAQCETIFHQEQLSKNFLIQSYKVEQNDALKETKTAVSGCKY